MQPAAGKGLASNHITKTGTSGAPGGGFSYGLLTKVAGAPKNLTWTTQPSASNTAGTAFATAPVVTVKDQFDNNVSKASVTLSITPGTGPAGATLTCPTNPVIANSIGAATFTGCKIDMAGTYTLRASSGAASADSNTVTVTGGSASKLVFKSYPAASTPAALTPQPTVAVVDAGGNTVTSQPPTTITLGITKNAGTFSCAGGLTATTVNGEATFTGCTQTTPDTGYALTASASFANTTGGTFAVSVADEPACRPSRSRRSAARRRRSPRPARTSARRIPASHRPRRTSSCRRRPARASDCGRTSPRTGRIARSPSRSPRTRRRGPPIGSATTNGSGDASVFYRPSDNRYYRVSFAGAADLGAATSPLVRVVVRALVFLRPAGCTSSNPCRISLNDEINFTATARPNRPELPQQFAQFVVQRKSGSTWVDADIDALVIPVSKATGTALFNVVFNVKGTWRSARQPGAHVRQREQLPDGLRVLHGVVSHIAPGLADVAVARPTGVGRGSLSGRPAALSSLGEVTAEGVVVGAAFDGDTTVGNCRLRTRAARVLASRRS